MKAFILVLYMATFSNHELTAQDATTGNLQISIISQRLLLLAKTKQPTDSLQQILAAIPDVLLTEQLKADNQKKAFWINIYNAFTQIGLLKNPGRYKKRNQFFSDKQIEIAGHLLSLDDIEHGILRRSKVKWAAGYLNKWFTGRFEKNNRVEKSDYRIHFALNCGAKSCPPIAFYKPEQLDRQLDIATKAYLSGEAEYKEAENKVYLPAIMGWFRADFGGKKKMMELLYQKEIVPAGKSPAIRFKKYNWNLFLENYKSETL